MTKSRGINRPKAKWTDEKLDRLKLAYADTNSQKLADEFEFSLHQVYAKAHALGLKKSHEYRLLHAGCFKKGDRAFPSGEFKQGLVPWNKGKKGLICGGKETQFKPGHKPANWLPIGSEKMDRDGYLVRKVEESGKQHHRWRFVHVLVWESVNGPVPKGYMVNFIDGNRQNIAIENLKLISKAENMARNTLHNYPPEIKQVIHMRASLTKMINKRERHTA